VKILAGDVGGTKTLLAILEKDSGGWKILFEARLASREIREFPEACARFVASAGHSIERASFGVPGPVTGNRAQGTNLRWAVDGSEIASGLGLASALVINDFAAQALGILEAGPADFASLNPDAGPADPRAPAAVLGAGTGLGEAVIVPAEGRAFILSTEGGHADFAPRTETEIALLRFLVARHGRVSVERVLSGAGIAVVYEFLRDSGAERESPALKGALADAPDPAAEISRAAIDAGDRLAIAALDLFVSVYGAEAGNMALRVLARGGVYVTGGIAAKILPRLRGGGFLAAFVAKGRLSELLRTLPVHVVLNPRVGLLGAAAEGLR